MGVVCVLKQKLEPMLDCTNIHGLEVTFKTKRI